MLKDDFHFVLRINSAHTKQRGTPYINIHRKTSENLNTENHQYSYLQKY
jgi:hypothetical protein